MPRHLYLAELALIVGGALAWLMFDSDGGPTVRDHRPPERSMAATDEAPAPTREPLTAARDWIGRRRASTSADLGHVVRGVVRGPDGPIASATIYAHRVSERDRARPQIVEDPDVLVSVCRYSLPPVATARSRADGSYELVLPSRTRDWQVDLGCFRSGYERRLRKDVRVPSAGCRMDFVLGRGMFAGGFVTTACGSAVAGLRIRVSRRQFGTTAFQSTARFDTGVERCADRWSSFHEGSAITDANGTFSVSGLAPGRYSVVCESREWIVWPAQVVRIPAPEFHVVVAPADSLTVDVDTGESDVPVDKPRVTLTMRRPVQKPDGSPGFVATMRSGVGRGNTCRLVWADLDRQGHPIQYDVTQEVFVTVGMRGFETYRRKLLWNFARTRHRRLSVRLEQRPRREVLLSTQYSDGTEVTNDLLVEYARSQSEVVGTTVATHTKPWLHRCELPVGSWFLRIRERSPFGSLNACHSEVEVVRKACLNDIVIPKGGTVTVHAPPGMSMRDLSLMARGAELSTEIKSRDDTAVLANVPAGTWDLLLSQHGKLLASRRVEVQANGRYTVRF